MALLNTSSSRWLFGSVLLLVVGALLCSIWPVPRHVFYRLYRERTKEQALESLVGYQMKSSEHFDLMYTESDRNVVDMVISTAESVYQPVTQPFGFESTQRIPLIIEPSRDEMRKAFGWSSSESAMGVYWGGTIRLLSPNVWADASSDRELSRVFRKLNPLAHELTHYVVDYQTNGNYPRWFTEGVAQWIEYRVTGFLWLEPESTLRQSLYSLAELTDRFDSLSNQPLAYRESYLLVKHIADTSGEDGLVNLVAHLAAGMRFDQAVTQVTGMSVNGVYESWQEWVGSHLDQLDPAS